MKGILVTTDNQIEVKDFDAPLHHSLGEAVGGYIEIVHPVGLADPLVMIVNEEGLLQELPINQLGCLLYGTHNHGHPIVGNVVVMKTGWIDGEPDIVGLSDDEAHNLVDGFRPFMEVLE